MENEELRIIAVKWLQAKQHEVDAITYRRLLEDEIMKLLPALQGDSTWSHVLGEVHIKISSRINRTIDSDKLQELAQEAGLTEYLSTLFRWKPELDIKRWRETDKSITAPLEGAITSKPGRPSFQITIEQETK